MGAALAMQSSLAQRAANNRQIAGMENGDGGRGGGLEFKQSISRTETIALGVLVWALFFGLWELSAQAG